MPDLPPEYSELTMDELLILYEHRPDECPVELRGWLECAILARDLARAERSLRGTA